MKIKELKAKKREKKIKKISNYTRNNVGQYAKELSYETGESEYNCQKSIGKLSEDGMIQKIIVSNKNDYIVNF